MPKGSERAPVGPNSKINRVRPEKYNEIQARKEDEKSKKK